jgi:recombination protein RecA
MPTLVTILLGKNGDIMAKKNDDNFEYLKGFIQKGARAGSSGFVPTGHFNLDFGIRYGILPENVDFDALSPTYDPKEPLGLPLGKIVELFGSEASGKSSLAYRVCGCGQKLGYKALWIDTEHSFADNLAELNGVDLEQLDYSSLFDPDNPDKNLFAEDIMDLIVFACLEYKIVVLDSVANLIPKEVAENTADKQNIAKLARILSAQLGKIAHYAAKNNVLVIFINQVREMPGTIYGDPTTTPGGRALKFNASIRIRVNKTNEVIFIEDDTGQKLIGAYSNVALVKNRLAQPLLNDEGKRIQLQIPIYYKPYFPNIEDRMFDFGRQMKLIAVRKNVYKWGEIKVETRNGFIQYIKDNGLSKSLMDELNAKAAEQGIIVPPEILLANLDDDKDTEKTKRIPRTRKKSSDTIGPADAA